MGRKEKKEKTPKPTVVAPPPPPPPIPSPSATSSSATSSSSPSSSDHDDTFSSPPSQNHKKSTSSADVTPKPKSKSTSSHDVTPKPTTVAALPSLPTSKRPSDSHVTPSQKKPKKDKPNGPEGGPSTPNGPGPNGGVGGATPQKALFQRVWSVEDEIVLLKGLVEYKAKKGVDPMSNVDDFHDFVKESLHVAEQVTNKQILGKVKRLRKRFDNAKGKRITVPRDILAFQLSNQVWGPVEDSNNNNNKDDKESKKNNKNNGDKESKNVIAGEKRKEKKSNKDDKESKSVVAGEKGKGGEEEEGKEGWVNLEEVGEEEGEGGIGMLGGNEAILREAMRRMGEEERGEMRREVDRANAAYLEAYLRRIKVMEIAANRILSGIKKDNDDDDEEED